ncbi:hypothetical protein EDD18DRAFT_1162127 [Armillaria luteobubalina]|uniref:Secreted protein n=1 Tax=Armillaria luteobubalina TaxID=153913 RepID=A0AA39Q927_9AGAR|nr:hypothetical protein EDD18DRAFT_1162127 [Armillaria luteobubalina]
MAFPRLVDNARSCHRFCVATEWLLLLAMTMMTPAAAAVLRRSCSSLQRLVVPFNCGFPFHCLCLRAQAHHIVTGSCCSLS